MNEHINLIRSIAWNFHRTTGIQWQELFSEACLAYCESLKSYNPKKSASTTWAYHAMKNALINFCKRESEHRTPYGVEEWFESSSLPAYEFFEDLSLLSEDTQKIIRMVRKNPRRYVNRKVNTPRKSLGRIKRDLREQKKWSWPRIWRAMYMLRVELIHPNYQRTLWLN